MYGGKKIAAGDTVYLFASENEGGPGLIAMGVVTAAKATPRKPGVERQTPRVSIEVKTQRAREAQIGRAELKPFSRLERRPSRDGAQLQILSPGY